MEMRRGLVALLLLPAAAAQMVIEPARVPRSAGVGSLACQAAPIKPALTFGLRLQAGYTFRIPLSQFSGPGHSLTVLTTIAPEGEAPPVYLVDRLRLATVPQTDAVVEAGGSYFLGEGRYQVDWLLLDETGRSCRKRWEVDAELGRADRDLKLAMAPHAVTDISLGAAGVHHGGSLRLTILLDAAPIPPARDVTPFTGGGAGLRGGGGRGGGGRGMRPTVDRMPPVTTDAPRTPSLLHAGDRMLLLGALSAMLEQLPAASVRLVVFNLEQQKELYRADDFGMESLHEVSRTMNQLQLGTIDVHTLQNRTGHLDLLAGLINAELHAPTPADTVVFLGPRERFHDRIPDELLDERHGAPPRFFFLAYQRPAPIRPHEDVSDERSLRRSADIVEAPSKDFPDSVSLAVGKLKGKTIVIETPRQFSKAIHTVAR
jgi:hypothetical protein